MCRELLPPKGKFELGLNYWASHAATEMWSNWDEDVIRKDLSVISAHGFTLLRVFPRWDEFQPIRGLREATGDNRVVDVRMAERVLPDTPLGRCGLSETMMERFEKFCDIAGEYQLRLIVPLLTGHMTTRLYVPEALVGLDLYRDAFALKYEILFIKGFVERMKHHDAIAAWESGNETNFLGKIQFREEAWVWSYLIHSTIKESDPSRPVIGVSLLPPASGKKLQEWDFDSQRNFCDMITVHPYAMWFEELLPDDLTSLRATHHAPLENKMLSDMSKMTSFIEETGTWRPQIGSADTLAKSLRSILWNSWREDSHALLWWCAFDQTKLPFAPYDWDWAGLEHGVFTAEQKPYPAATVCRDFMAMQKTLPFALPPMKSDRKVLVLLNDRKVGYSTGILARQAGIVFDYRWTKAALEDAEVYFLPSCEGRGGLSSRTWEALKGKIRDGATLYISLDNCYIDRLRDVCGCEVLYRKQMNDSVTADFGEFTLTYQRKYRFQMGCAGATVLATEEDGNPVFFKYSYGKGTVYTLAFPLEKRLLEVADSFEGDGKKLYEYIFPVKRIFRPERNSVLCTEHSFDDGRTALMLTNCSHDEFEQDFNYPVEEQYSDSGANVSDGKVRLPGSSGLLLVIRDNK